MIRKPTPRADIALGTFLIAVCAATLWETRDIPPGSFEPLGSAPVPQAVASLIVLLSLVVIARAWLALRRPPVPGAPDAFAGDDGPPRWADAALVTALTVVYALALHYRVGRFDVATTAYLIVTIGALTRFRRAALPWVIVVSALTGFGCQYVFTRVFIVDLPGAF